MELCNKAASRQTTTNDAGVGEVANAPAVVPNGRNTSVQDSASKRFGKMLKIVIPLLFAAAFIMVAVMLNRRAEKFDYIAAVKEHKPFVESLNLDYTYEDVFERYISGASWSSQETATGADVTVHGSAAGLDKDIAISVEVTTSSEVIVVDPKLVEFDGEKLSNEDDLVSFLLVLFQAYDVGYEDFTDILNDELFSDSEQQGANIETVQKGYLGEYTDIAVKDLLGGHYSLYSYDEETWDSGTTEDGKEIVQVTYHDEDDILEDVNIQFTMLSDEVFKVTAPWSAIVFFVADDVGGGMTLTSANSFIEETGISFNDDGETIYGYITEYTFDVPPVSGHNGSDYGRVEAYNIRTGQWDEIAYKTTNNGVTLSGKLPTGTYTQMRFYYYTNHDCMYNKSNITYSIVFDF